jgi:hypothetical protein
VSEIMLNPSLIPATMLWGGGGILVSFCVMYLCPCIQFIKERVSISDISQTNYGKLMHVKAHNLYNWHDGSLHKI